VTEANKFLHLSSFMFWGGSKKQGNINYNLYRDVQANRPFLQYLKKHMLYHSLPTNIETFFEN
jgi:hypothetical protein